MTLQKTFTVGLAGGLSDALLRLDKLVAELCKYGDIEIISANDTLYTGVPKTPTENCPIIARSVVYRIVNKN